MLTSDQINKLHRLYVSERWPIRKLERHLKMGWKTIKKYLDAPAQVAASRQRQSKLDPFKAVIAECLEKDPRVTAALILQRIKDLGYSGGHAILQGYVHNVRPEPASKRAFVRMEPFAGERFEVDWAHFDALNYSAGRRGFDPRLALHVFNGLEVIESLSVTAITALSSPDHLAEPVGGCFEHPPTKPQTPHVASFQEAFLRKLPARNNKLAGRRRS